MNITEKYFRAIGWEYHLYLDKCFQDEPWFEQSPHNKIVWDECLYHEELPNITQFFPDFKLHVWEKMRMKMYIWKPTIDPYAIVRQRLNEIEGCPEAVAQEEIKNNEILEAAVIAATRYFETKGKKES